MLRKTKLIVIIVVISLLFILSLPFSTTRNIKIKLVSFFSPVIKASNYVIDKIFSIKDVFTAVRENRNLKIKIGELSSKCNELQEAHQENQRLKDLLDLKKMLPYDSIACRVIARDASSWHKSFIIDKGRNAGIYLDMPVLGNGSLAGRIADCNDDESRVLLITDVNSNVGGATQDARIFGIVKGEGSNECIFDLMSKKEEIQIGATIVTSGLSRIFPKGLMIGTIISIAEAGQGLYKTARIKLSADIDKIEEVLVLKIQKAKI